MIVPAVRTLFKDTFGGNGQSIFTASVLLGIMILPTIIGIAESAIRAVPERYYQGALALGATHERAVFLTVVPAAKSGIMAGIVLGIGRAIGEQWQSSWLPVIRQECQRAFFRVSVH